MLIFLLGATAIAAPFRQPLSNTEFIDFLNHYADMEPAVVAQRFSRLTDIQQEKLAEWEMLGADIVTKLCHSEEITASFTWEATSGAWSCTDLLQREAQAHQWGAADSVKISVKSHQSQLLSTVKVSSNSGTLR